MNAQLLLKIIQTPSHWTLNGTQHGSVHTFPLNHSFPVREGGQQPPAFPQHRALSTTRSRASQAHFQPHSRGILRNLLFQDVRLLFLKVGDKQRQMQLNYADGEIWDRKAEIPRWCSLTQTCSRRIKAVRWEGESSIHTGPFTPS